MATIFGKRNNDNKTELFLAKVNHFKFLPVAKKTICDVGAILDATPIDSF